MSHHKQFVDLEERESVECREITLLPYIEIVRSPATLSLCVVLLNSRLSIYWKKQLNLYLERMLKI